MKALSVKQPWAELIASGRKTIEVRTWAVGHRGPLLIVASAQADRERCEEFDLSDPVRGVAVCVVDLNVIATADRDRYAAGACCGVWRGDSLWHLVNPRRVAPVPIKGRLRLYDVPDENIRVLPVRP